MAELQNLNLYEKKLFCLISGKSKKVFLDLGRIEKFGFLHVIQHVLNITFQVFLGVVKLFTIFAVFQGKFWSENFSSC